MVIIYVVEEMSVVIGIIIALASIGVAKLLPKIKW